MLHFRGMSLQEIRDELKELGVPLTNEQFNALTYAELNKMGRKAYKAYRLYKQVDDIVKASPEGTSILVMSNGSFNGIHQRLLDKLK